MRKIISILLCLLLSFSVNFCLAEDEAPTGKTITYSATDYLNGVPISWSHYSHTDTFANPTTFFVYSNLYTHDLCDLTATTVNGTAIETTDFLVFNSENFNDGDVIDVYFYYTYNDANVTYPFVVEHIFEEIGVTESETYYLHAGDSYSFSAKTSASNWLMRREDTPGGRWYLGMTELIGGENNSVIGTLNDDCTYTFSGTMIHQDVYLAFYYYFIPDPEPTSTPEPTPTVEPTSTPAPTDEPEPTPEPTSEPEPTEEPTIEPTEEPTPAPTEEPTSTPEPTEEPTPEPTEEPTPEPTEEPTHTPEPTEVPVETPEPIVTEEPTSTPTVEPTATPEITVAPTSTPEVTEEPTIAPESTTPAPPSEEPEPTVTEAPEVTPEPELPTPKPVPAPAPTPREPTYSLTLQYYDIDGNSIHEDKVLYGFHYNDTITIEDTAIEGYLAQYQGVIYTIPNYNSTLALFYVAEDSGIIFVEIDAYRTPLGSVFFARQSGDCIE